MIKIIYIILILSINQIQAKINPIYTLVSSISELERKIKSAHPGDTIVLKNGHYHSSCGLYGEGTKSLHIIIKAETIGKVIMNGSLTIFGNSITLNGFNFSGNNGRITVNGNDNRITNSTISKSKANRWVVVETSAYNTEIDHCLFENKYNNSNITLLRRNQLLQVNASEDDTKSHNHKIHHNHFRNVPKGYFNNGYETIQLYTVSNIYNPKGINQYNKIYNNLFENCNGEGELISVKSNGNFIINNTIIQSKGQIVLRQGHNSIISDNIIIVTGNDEIKSGIRIQGENQKILNNYLIGKMKSSIVLHDTQYNYMKVKNFIIDSNIIYGSRYAIRIGIGTEKIREPIENGTFSNNILNGIEKSIKYDGVKLPIDINWKNNFSTGEHSDLEELNFIHIEQSALDKISIPFNSETVGPL